MDGSIFHTAQAAPTADRFALENPHMLRVVLDHTTPDVIATKGSMVAYSGNIEFKHKAAGSITKMLKRFVTSEDTPLMQVSGRGDVYLADLAKPISLLDLEGDGLSVSGANLLAFDATIDYDIHRVKGAGMLTGGMFNTVLRGTGRVAITTDGHPVVLDASQRQVCVDLDAVVCWSANLDPTIKSSVHMGSMLRGGSGEAIQYVFSGDGFVVVQPSEAPRKPASNNTSGTR